MDIRIAGEADLLREFLESIPVGYTVTVNDGTDAEWLGYNRDRNAISYLPRDETEVRLALEAVERLEIY